MIKKIIESFFARKVSFVFEEQLLSRFVNESNEICRPLLLLQLNKIKNTIRSDDGRVVKVQYGRKRDILEKNISIKLTQEESVIGRLIFKQKNKKPNVLQVIQINGMISNFEYKNPPSFEKYDAELVIFKCELYLKSRVSIDPFSLIESIRAVAHFEEFIIHAPRPPGLPDEIKGAEASFSEIPTDYFRLCSVCDGFFANGWEFLGLRFRQIDIDYGDSNFVIILAQCGYRHCIALANDATDGWRLFQAEINIEEISFKKVNLLDSNFHLAFANMVNSSITDK